MMFLEPILIDLFPSLKKKKNKERRRRKDWHLKLSYLAVSGFFFRKVSHVMKKESVLYVWVHELYLPITNPSKREG